MKFGVVQFPGSNCDDDAFHAIGSIIGQPVEFIWHQSEDVSGLRRDYPSRRICLRRLPAHRRDRAIFAGDARGRDDSRARADWCSASATDFRFCSKRDCFPAR